MHNLSMATLAGLSVAVALSACSPEQNWREVSFDGTSVKAQLPCKPDRTTRSVPLGGVPLDMQVVGCESGNATLAVMTVALPSATDANALLTGWQQATLRNAQVKEPRNESPRAVWQGAGFLPLAASVRIQAQGQRGDGRAVAVDAAWGAVPEGDHVRLVHAVVYATGKTDDLANTLMEGLRP
ncbi:hypothetical protein B9Z51_11795 [Limnohabitans sp. T6-5]|uniref:hypothetical protein n=1 Tax=Limnohabitans sp. T6-5 TaxID=1100724 RepID=UPI000D3A9091|nr:hypothetical protein [Limnohabitans sp. T6-5]PUE09528.1 hypothetical protein B9Z51_11795 [Limnohabitans sp. T6-5]